MNSLLLDGNIYGGYKGGMVWGDGYFFWGELFCDVIYRYFFLEDVGRDDK